jgi:DNA-binding NtrC family response regulator
MNINKKWNVLLIKDELSMFDSDTKMFNTLFNKVDKVLGRSGALKLFKNNNYDIVICDISVRPEEVAFMKQLIDMKLEQTIFVLVSPKDTDKLYGIADLGIHAFELEPTQFDQALETIAQFNPYAEAQ